MSHKNKRDYYEVLGISRSASQDDIKRAFRQLAMKHHPDRGGDAEKFKEINEAYQILSDENKRAQYDRFGFEAPGLGGFEGQGFSSFSDIFDMFFGSGFGGFGGRSGRSGARSTRRIQGEDVEVKVKVPFKEAVFGAEKTVEYKRYEPCSDCDGTGADDPNAVRTCSNCKGSGQETRTTRTVFGMATQVTECRQCGGTGQIITSKCRTCSGRKMIARDHRYKITIPAGIDSGVYLKAEGQGHLPAKDSIPGDLLIGIVVDEDQRFEREGYDIITENPVDFAVAIKGGEVLIETIDGPFKLRIDQGTSPDTLIRLKGKGIPTLESHGKQRGNHIVKIKVSLPRYNELSRDQKRLIDEYIATLR